jgi:threonine dehydrogenase-like Zn-dependent dehydrogenase
MKLPATQRAIQLVGPGELKLTETKEVPVPGPHQVVARVEAVGLCFSDLKLLKQFSQHARKGEILEGLPREVLNEIPSYVPDGLPTVPGHEVVCRIVAVGNSVRHHSLNERCLVQTDYRTLRTANSNAAFGYNFEGGLQEYVLMDERVIIDPLSGERFLIRVSEELSASAVALVEPWACVEDSYANLERQGIKPVGRLLVVADEGARIEGLTELLEAARPGLIVALRGSAAAPAVMRTLGICVESADDLSSLPAESFDDIIYFGVDPRVIETLNDKLAPAGIANIVTGGRRIGEPVSIGIGRVHYGMTRWTGTTGNNAADAYRSIPACGEIRRGERIAVVGAGGPMGQMHVIRNICQGVPDISIVGTDVDDSRLHTLAIKAGPLARANRVQMEYVNTTNARLSGRFSYYALLAPIGKLVADAIANSSEGCLINVFAGIPAPTREKLDLDTYISNRCFMFGTSGSVIRDMRIVLEKVERGQLDTNTSVDAIAGMAGAQEGLAAVEDRRLAGKIIVYPMLRDLGLIPLTELARRFPSVGEKLEAGQWTKAAEQELLRVAGAIDSSVV